MTINQVVCNWLAESCCQNTAPLSQVSFFGKVLVGELTRRKYLTEQGVWLLLVDTCLLIVCRCGRIQCGNLFEQGIPVTLTYLELLKSTDTLPPNIVTGKQLKPMQKLRKRGRRLQ